MKALFLITVLLVSKILTAQDTKPAYIIYSNSKQVDYAKMLEKCSEADIVFFGEHHNNPIHHWLQHELTKDLYEKKSGKIILGAEMFETDNQLVLNEYLQELIKEKNFKEEVKLWNNYETDYKPLIEFAKENSLDFIATNIPRRYAAVVNHSGFEGLTNLSEETLTYIAPIPIPFDSTLSSYKQMSKMMMPGKSGSSNIALAQASKDATMAYFILENYKQGYTFIHFNGSYHSDYYEGIIWYFNHYLDKKEKNKNIVSISVEEVDDMNTKPDMKRADFIIVTPITMTKTY